MSVAAAVRQPDEAWEADMDNAALRAIAAEGYIYGYPMVDGYRVQYSCFENKTNPEYIGSVEPLGQHPEGVHRRGPSDRLAELGHAVLPGRDGPPGGAAGADRAADRSRPLLQHSADRRLHPQLRLHRQQDDRQPRR